MAAMLQATMIWLASLVTFPAPTGPVRVTVEPIFRSRGSTLSNASRLPPTMMASVPSMAFGSPPLTGASRNPTPLAAQAAPTFWETIGLIELISTSVAPARGALQHPSRAQDRFLHIRTIRQHGDDDVGPPCGVLAGSRARRAGRHQFLHGGRSHVEDNQPVTRPDQIAGHGLTHDAKTDETYRRIRHLYPLAMDLIPHCSMRRADGGFTRLSPHTC